jgi:hypothetical protein
MPIIQIDNLGRSGLVQDIEPYTLEPQMWSAGLNARFLNDRAFKFLGSEEVLNTWSAATVPLWLQPWNDNVSQLWLAPCKTKILLIDSASTLDVSRTVGGAYTATDDSIWSGGIIGGVPVLNNDAGDHPQSWDGGTSKFVDLPNWTSGDVVKIMRVFKQYLVGYDYTPTGGARQPHTVKWSNPALPGTIPTKWDNADDNDSNEQPLSEGGGIILDAQPLGDYMVVYKEEATYLQQLVQSKFVFNFRRIFDADGILAPRCAKTFERRHFVVTQDDVKVHNGQISESVIDKKNRDWFFNNLQRSTERQTFVTPNYAKNEMWICFISESVAGTFADTALVWNWKENTWGVRELPSCPHIAWGPLEESGVSQIIDDQEQIQDTDDSIIDGAAFGSGQQSLVGSSSTAPNSRLIALDRTNLEMGSSMRSYLERTGIAIVGRDQFGNWKVDPSSSKFLRRVWLKMEATGQVNVYLGVQQRLEGAVAWTGPFDFTPGITPHLDCRLHGKTFGVKIESTGDVNWSCTGMNLDVEIIGGETR